MFHKWHVTKGETVLAEGRCWTKRGALESTEKALHIMLLFSEVLEKDNLPPLKVQG